MFALITHIIQAGPENLVHFNTAIIHVLSERSVISHTILLFRPNYAAKTENTIKYDRHLFKFQNFKCCNYGHDA